MLFIYCIVYWQWKLLFLFSTDSICLFCMTEYKYIPHEHKHVLAIFTINFEIRLARFVIRVHCNIVQCTTRQLYTNTQCRWQKKKNTPFKIELKFFFLFLFTSCSWHICVYMYIVSQWIQNWNWVFTILRITRQKKVFFSSNWICIRIRFPYRNLSFR